MQNDYEEKLFDRSRVHEIDLEVEDWDLFLENAGKEEYRPCTIQIDGEKYAGAGIRVKGNNSRRLTEKYGLKRYSLKIEFDHYKKGTYHGLDKFSLDASFQDNSYMKTWLAYDMMNSMDVPVPLTSYAWVRVNGEDWGLFLAVDASFQDNSYMKTWLAYDMMNSMDVPVPLTSYAWVRVNGEDWGLFLAVEEPEEAFARRNFGENYGQLYKPDYKSLQAENADVALRYTDDDFKSYDNIFRQAKFPVSEEDKKRLIEALRVLSEGGDLESAVNVDEVLRYFTVQVFVVNMDSYLGRTGHNYFLYEEEGRISILPWDYNLAFATYALGMPNPIRDATVLVNMPINTPASGEVMKNRPLYHNLMKNPDYYAQYHVYFDQLLKEYFESGYFKKFLEETKEMIAPYVEQDPTAFCSYEDFLLGADTLEEFCRLRAESARGQLEGRIPSTIRTQKESRKNFVDASSIFIQDLGEIADLKD